MPFNQAVANGERSVAVSTRPDTRNQSGVLSQLGQQGLDRVQRLRADVVFHSLYIMINRFLPDPERAQEICEKVVT